MLSVIKIISGLLYYWWYSSITAVANMCFSITAHGMVWQWPTWCYLGKLSVLCRTLHVFRSVALILTLWLQVCMDHGIINYYIKTIRASCVKLTREDYFTLPATRVFSHTSWIDAELESREVVEGSSISGCSSVTGRFVFRMCHHRDHIYEDAFSGLNLHFPFFTQRTHIYGGPICDN